MEEKDRHFLFGIVASVGLCFIILVFFTGDEALKDNPAFLYFFLFLLFIILFLLIVYFALEIIFVSPSTKWHIVTECSQDQELRSKRKLLFHPEVTVFPDSVISYCEAVEQVEFASSDCYFMAGSFEGCVNLEYIKLPHRLERIPDNMFKNCSSLKEIIIPSTVKSIGKNAFDGCSGLTSVEIPSSVTSIGERAFSGCSGLTSVEIPASVTSIGRGAFKGCSGLTSVNFGYTNYWYYTSSLENAANKTGGTVVPLSSTDLAANATLVRNTYVSYYWYKVD